MDFRLPIPNNWQDFESICHRLWGEIWNDINTQKNGRQGQAQNGVDIFGQPIYQTPYHGVQCKDKNGQLGSSLSESELKDECTKAVNFTPKIESFTLATTAPRDVAIQKIARELTLGDSFPFDVNVWSWDDIESEISYRPNIMNHYYPKLQQDYTDSFQVKLNRYSTKDHLYAYFTRPQIESLISNKFRSYIMPLIYELSDNSYKYGQASQFEIQIKEGVIHLIDNGIPFNPLDELDSTKVNSKGNVGSFIFNTFQQKFKNELSIDYSRIADSNILSIKGEAISFLIDDDTHIEFDIDLRQAYGRNNARKLAAQIPLEKDDIYLNFGEVRNVSVAVEFVQETLDRLKDHQTLNISIPRHEYLDQMPKWFDDQRLKVKTRK